MKVYFNGSIITMEDEQPQAELLIEDKGKIVYVGEKKLAPSCEDAQWINLEGHTLMPAFIDAHGHFANTATFLKTVPLQNATKIDDIVKSLKEYLDKHQDENITRLIGMGYDHNFLQEDTHPTKFDLDKVSETIPIIVIHTSMHMAVANSKLLEMAGITNETAEIPGGVIARDAQTGDPIGLLEEMAMHAVLPFVGNIFSAESIEDLEHAQDFYIRHGILTIQDGASNIESVKLMRDLAGKGKLKCDVVSYPCFTMGDDAQKTVHENNDCVKQYVDRFKIGGYKIVLDGSPQCKTAWLSKPYEGEDEYAGYPWITDEAIQTYINIALDEDMQVLTHCNGDASGDQLLEAYEKSLARFDENSSKKLLRPVMIHCQTVREDQLDRMEKLSMIASIFVGHVNYWGDVHLRNLGPERGARISPVKSALDRGISVNFHTDTPVTMPDFFHSIWSAVNRVTKKGIVLGADQCIDVWNALKAVTINAAYSYFEEDEKGSLKAGKKADLIIVDKNPLSVEKDQIKDIKVLTAIKEGKVVYQAE